MYKEQSDKSINSYIWDEWNSDEENAATRRSSPSPPPAYASLVTPAASLAPLAIEVNTTFSSKISTLKSSIKDQISQNKTLQAELVRLQNSIERRRQKAEFQWETELKSLETQHTETINKMEAFYGKVDNDVKKLQMQFDELNQKIKRQENDRLVSMEHAKADILKKQSKARRQWEHEERQVMEKTLASKVEVMKKQAADILSPKLDQFVAENKGKVALLRQEKEEYLHKLRLEIQSETNNNVSNARSTLRDDLQKELEKAKELGEKRLKEVKRKQELDIISWKDKIDREKQRISESNEKNINQEYESHLRAMQSFRERESHAVRELLDQQNREVSKLLQVQAEEITNVKVQLAKEIEIYHRQLKKQMDVDQEIKYEQLVRKLMQNISSDLTTVLQKVREENSLERKNMKEKMENEIIDLRYEIESKIRNMRSTEATLNDRVNILRNEITEFAAKVDLKRIIIPELQKELGAILKPQIQTLREELHNVEELWLSFEEKQVKYRKQMITSFEDSTNEYLEKLASAEDQEISLEDSLHKKQSHLESEYHRDLDRIKNKIEAVLQKKDRSIHELYEELNIARQELGTEESRLEEIRSRSFAH